MRGVKPDTLACSILRPKHLSEHAGFRKQTPGAGWWSNIVHLDNYATSSLSPLSSCHTFSLLLAVTISSSSLHGPYFDVYAELYTYSHRYAAKSARAGSNVCGNVAVSVVWAIV